MRALEFWKAITVDDSDLLGRVLNELEVIGVPYCVIGGQAVNAYVDPVVSLDLDVVVAANGLAEAVSRLSMVFQVQTFAHSVNISDPASDLRIQVQTDPRYGEFVGRAARRMVLGLELPVATVEDVLQGKIWAVLDPERPASKRQKDLADIARLIEAYPELAPRVPDEVRKKLL